MTWLPPAWIYKEQRLYDLSPSGNPGDYFRERSQDLWPAVARQPGREWPCRAVRIRPIRDGP